LFQFCSDFIAVRYGWPRHFVNAVLVPRQSTATSSYLTDSAGRTMMTQYDNWM